MKPATPIAISTKRATATPTPIPTPLPEGESPTRSEAAGWRVAEGAAPVGAVPPLKTENGASGSNCMAMPVKSCAVAPWMALSTPVCSPTLPASCECRSAAAADVKVIITERWSPTARLPDSRAQEMPPEAAGYLAEITLQTAAASVVVAGFAVADATIKRARRDRIGAATGMACGGDALLVGTVT